MADNVYHSCIRLEGDLNLVFERLQFCCVTHSSGKGSVKICDFHGGPLPFDEIARYRRELTEQNNADGVDTPCKGCEFLVKREWPPNQGIFRTIAIGNFTVCNLRCEYCPSSQPEFKDNNFPKYAYRLGPVFADAIRSGHLTSDTCILWAGGEPTILPDFEEVAEMLINEGMKQTIFSNCVVFSPFVELGLRRRLFNMVISVDSGTRATFARVKGRNLFDKVWANIARYAATGADITLKYIVYRNNSDFEDIRRFVERSKSLGIAKLAVVPENFEFAHRNLSDESLRAAALLIRLAREADIRVLDLHCFGPRYHALILSYIDELGQSDAIAAPGQNDAAGTRPGACDRA